MWDFIIDPMTTLLILMYKLMGQDVVLAIVVLTVILRMVMYPLFAQQQRSAQKMQEIQPRLKKIQEKYKDDREKLATAQMELYKEAGINPLGGCLPMLLQFPIFIALYQAIFFALAATPFQLVDLSERLLMPSLANLIPLQNMWLGMQLTEPPSPPNNPTYALILPALVMLTTWIQFKYSMAQTNTAPAGDDDGKPNQAQAMSKSMGTIMPIMFGMISLSLSVGLAIYFIASNLVGVVQYLPGVKDVLDRIFGGGKKTEVVALEDNAEIVPSAKDKDKPRKKGKST